MSTRVDFVHKGRWIYRLITNIEVGIGRKHDQVNFYLSQLLTGHGCYRAFLYKYGHDVDEMCPIYQNTSETAEHVFFTCPRYELQRNLLERTIGTQVTDMLKLERGIFLREGSCNTAENNGENKNNINE